MARRPNTTPATVTTARIRWLERQLRKASQDHRGATDAGSWSAAASLLREQRALRDQLDTERLRLAESQVKPERELTDSERAAVLAGLVSGASEEELEVAVHEWLQRRRYRLVVDPSGTLQLLPLGESANGLRLVT